MGNGYGKNLGTALAVLALVMLSACINIEDDGAGKTRQNNGGNGAPIGDGDSQASGAPIDIPAITISQNWPPDDAVAAFEQAVTDVCGGELCVVVDTDERDGGRQTCQYSGRTDPPAGTSVQRGSTVVLIMGTQPCIDTDGDDISGNLEGDGLPDDSDGTPDVSDVDPDDDTTPEPTDPAPTAISEQTP